MASLFGAGVVAGPWEGTDEMERQEEKRGGLTLVSAMMKYTLFRDRLVCGLLW